MKNVKIGQLVRWGSHIGESVIGYVIDVKGNNYQAVFSDEVPLEHVPEYLYMDSEFLLDVYDVVVHEPKEDKLTVAQEASNNAFMAVQGILQALAEKNGETIKPSFTSRMYSREEWEASYELGRQDGISEGFTFSDFDTSVKRTWKDQNFKDAVSNAALGLTGEAGEVADLIKKAIYHGRGFSEIPNSGGIQKKDVKDELSDVLFYVSAMAQEFGFTLEDVARHNKEKLEKRYEKGFTVEESAQKRDKLSFPRNMIVKNPTKYYKKFEIVHVTGETDTHYLSGEVKIPKEVF